MLRRTLSLLFALVIAAPIAVPHAGTSAHASGLLPMLFRCSNILEPIAAAGDAVPFVRRFLDRQLSKGWFERFDFSLYQKFRKDYRAMDPLPLEQWGLPESSLAYLETLLERAGGFRLTLADSILDDPTRARRLQLLFQQVDLAQPLTRYELERLVESAYLLDGGLDLVIRGLRKPSTQTLRKVVRQHVRKEIATAGVLAHYRSSGNLAKRETLGQTMLRLYEHPLVSAAMYIPTWTLLSSYMPGFLPKVQWVRISPADLKKFIEVGIDAHLPHAEPALRRALLFQTSYNYAQTFVAVWAGLFTLGYAAIELFELDTEQAEKLVLHSAVPALTELRTRVEVIR